jgi:hypothetical protein
MGMLKKILLAAGLAFWALPASAMDPITFNRVLATVKAYGTDFTQIFYCLRKDPEEATFRYAILHFEIENGLKVLKANGSDDKQNARFIEAVMKAVSFAPADAKDAALDPQCEKIVNDFYVFNGSGRPLLVRLAFLPNKMP